MALPDFIEITQGTSSVVWGESGGSGVTHALAVNGLANGSACQGAIADLGDNFSDEYIVQLFVETGATAPTVGTTYDVHLVSSTTNTNLPAKASGSSGSYTLGTNDANLRQAGAPSIVLVATADANTVLRQQPVIWRPRGRYVAPIFVNRSGQAVASKTPASDNATRIILTPRRTVVND
jgi:hypothetical protein